MENVTKWVLRVTRTREWFLLKTIFFVCSSLIFDGVVKTDKTRSVDDLENPPKVEQEKITKK